MRQENRLGPVDGLRGLMSLWVVVGHCCAMTGLNYLPVLRSPHYAVNGFMILSGLLMTYHYTLRVKEEPWTSPSTWFAFYVRRYWRISPLYYTLLIPAYLLKDEFAFWHSQIVAALGIVTPQPADPVLGTTHVLLHLTYLFGLFPKYHASLVLPDWSLSLEMQFYWLFPFFMLLTLRFGWIVFSCLMAAVWLFANSSIAGIAQMFVQPSPLVLSLLWFVIGMIWGAALLDTDNGRSRRRVLLGTALSILSMDLHNIVLVFGISWILFADGRLKIGKFADWLRAGLAGRVGKSLAEASYSVYLVHLLVLTPLAYFLSVQMHFGPLVRFIAAFVPTIIICYALAIPLSNIEKWGIRVGKQFGHYTAQPKAFTANVS